MRTILTLLKNKNIRTNKSTMPASIDCTNTTTAKNNPEQNDSADAGSFFISENSNKKMFAIRGGCWHNEQEAISNKQLPIHNWLTTPDSRLPTRNPWGPVFISELAVADNVSFITRCINNIKTFFSFNNSNRNTIQTGFAVATDHRIKNNSSHTHASKDVSSNTFL